MVLGLDLYVVLIGDIIVNGDARGKGRPVWVVYAIVG